MLCFACSNDNPGGGCTMDIPGDTEAGCTDLAPHPPNLLGLVTLCSCVLLSKLFGMRYLKPVRNTSIVSVMHAVELSEQIIYGVGSAHGSCNEPFVEVVEESESAKQLRERDQASTSHKRWIDGITAASTLLLNNPNAHIPFLSLLERWESAAARVELYRFPPCAPVTKWLLRWESNYCSNTILQYGVRMQVEDLHTGQIHALRESQSCEQVGTFGATHDAMNYSAR
eukprot:4598674-Amphidinium_carterae.3